MKHSTQDLLLAAALTQRAAQLRAASAPDGLSPEALAAWLVAPRGDRWLEEALREFEGVADFIAAARG